MEDRYDNSPVMLVRSRSPSSWSEGNRMSPRPPRVTAGAGRSSVWVATPGPPRGDLAAIFDPEYAVLRARLLSLARDGHRLIGRIAKHPPGVGARVVRGFLKRIARFDKQAAHWGLEPVRCWARSLERLVLDTASDRSCRNGGDTNDPPA